MTKAERGMYLLAMTLVWGACAEGLAQPAVRELASRWGNLDGPWLFRTDPREIGEERGWHEVDFDETQWRTLEAPGCWEAQGVTDPRPGESPRPKRGLLWRDYDGAAWYRIHFIVPATWAGQELLLRLGSVDDHDRAFLNGRLIGQTGRETRRAVSVHRVYAAPSEVVRFGAENVLAIRVFDAGGPGGLMGPALSLLPRAIMEAPMRLPQHDRPLRDQFADPSARSRILRIIHNVPDAPDQQQQFIDLLIAQGFGGVVCNVHSDGYLESDEKWEAFSGAVAKAKEAGMCLWLYDERGYPSGTAGGIVLRDHPEWEAHGLLIADALCSEGEIALDLPPGDLMLAAAYPKNAAGIDLAGGIDAAGIDLAGGIDLAERVADGKVTWNAPAGSWWVVAVTADQLYEGTHGAVSLADKQPYIDLLMPEPTARFIEVTHQQYAAHLGNDIGRLFRSTFTDEPSLMSVFLRPMPYKVLPWAPNLPGEFRKRRGRELEPLIPQLIADAPGCGKARCEFWLTIGELVAENFFGQIQEWCARHNILSGGHLLYEESLAAHVPFYGDFFRCARQLSAPSIDCLTSVPAQVPWVIARMMGSVADLTGREVTMSETSDHVQHFRPEGDARPPQKVSEEEIRGTCNRLILGGINTITSYYSFAGLSSEQLRRLNEWVGRCCTMLAGGHQVTDIAMLYPVESLWARFTPARFGPTDSASAMQVEKTFNRAASSLFEARRDFTFIDSKALEDARLEDGALVHGDLCWRVVILPAADTLPLPLWEKLARFQREGGAVISLTTLPANTVDEFPSARVEAMAAEMFGSGEGVVTHAGGGVGVFLPVGAELLLPIALDRMLAPDVRTADARSPIRATHRRIDEHDIYFLINDSGEGRKESVSVAGAGAGELWDPATGRVTQLPAGADIPLDLPPYGGVLLRYKQARRPERLETAGEALPGLTPIPLPAAEPSVGKGEFVNAELSAEAEGAWSDGPAWRAAATLTKGDVDTHLFVSFAYEPPIDLSDAHCLVVDTWVPDGQQTPTQILVMLHERDGVSYVAATGRSLGSPGARRSFAPISDFQLGGWCEDADGRLDLSAITAVSIGWGGYFGEEGEVIDLGVAMPQMVRIAR